ncbi:MAG: ABC transporter ATP-binding protein [Candidatus Eisenbacteria bacterium]
MLTIRNLTKRFDRTLVVDNVSLSCEKGETLAVLGPSGCGKTTLLRLIAGFERPDEGEILINGEVASTPDEIMPPSKRHLGMIFQDLALWPHMTVRENVEFGLTGNSAGRAQNAHKVTDILNKIGLADFEQCYPGQLSGGERQRVALARSLAAEPRVLLLDEPLSNLDSLLKAQMIRLIIDLRGDLTLTMIYVTHNLDEALDIAHRIAIMNQGRVEQVGSFEEMKVNPATKLVADFLRAVRNRGS